MWYINLPEYGLTTLLTNQYHSVWRALVGCVQWEGYSCVTSVHFGLIYARNYGYSVLVRVR